ncbi:MAG: hypothetical protein HY366_00450 [Candidatus Aenigmarchaeota archaeon]|nr:hypothetical protein [Candidatus Aenigmarchaeota archaeon]
MRFLCALVLLVAVSGCIGTSSQFPPDNEGSAYKTAGSDCKGAGTVEFGASPMRIEDISLIIPMGAMVGSHVTPIDHMYFSPAVFHSAPDTYNVYASADGIITSIGHEPHFAENKYEKYRLEIRHTCDFYSIYNLLTSLSPELQKITGGIQPGGYYGKPIQVKEGQLLGKIGGQTLDLSVNYDKVVLEGFIVPEHYAGEEWKIHTVDPFDYFKEPLRSELLAKNLRQVEPRGGKIDYDIEGRLVGNWFRDGIGYPRNYVRDSWKNHLSFVYDPVDPSHVIVSIGDYGGEPKQFGVKDNAPDPASISASTGLVRYELQQLDYVDENGEYWDRFSYDSGLKAVNQAIVHGVALVQIIEARKIKFEAFPGKTSSEVSGFTSAAKIYER